MWQLPDHFGPERLHKICLITTLWSIIVIGGFSASALTWMKRPIYVMSDLRCKISPWQPTRHRSCSLQYRESGPPIMILNTCCDQAEKHDPLLLSLNSLQCCIIHAVHGKVMECQPLWPSAPTWARPYVYTWWLSTYPSINAICWENVLGGLF